MYHQLTDISIWVSMYTQLGLLALKLTTMWISEPTKAWPSRTSAFSELHALVSSIVHQRFSSLQLQTPILLQGPSGIGKLTTAIAVAKSLGLHTQEVI
jgi:DNA polymerase III delta prime subunit